jgi:RNA polymerase sigma-70 factor (ECF subfamily)
VVAERVPGPSQQRTLRRLRDLRLREIVDGFAAALEAGDAPALVSLLTEDVTWSMPPMAHWYRGPAAVDFAIRVAFRCGTWRHVRTSANGQPAVAGYLRDDAGLWQAWSVSVLTVRDGRIAGITSFVGAEHFAAVGLPTSLS